MRIFGHRGAGCSGIGCRGEYPENSMASIGAAIALGAEGVEVDVWLTRDEELLVVHGSETGEKVLEGSNVDIEEHTYEELNEKAALKLPRPWIKSKVATSFSDPVEDVRSLPAEQRKKVEQEYWNEAREADQDEDCKIPTLRDVLSCFLGRVQFNVELKGTTDRIGPKVVALTREYPGAVDRISSFEWGSRDKPDLLAPIKHNSEGVPLGLLFDDAIPLPPKDEMLESVRSYGASFIHVPHKVTRQQSEAKPDQLAELVRDMRAEEVGVMAWFPGGVDDPDGIQSALEAEAEICPNDVALAVKLRDLATARMAQAAA